MSFMLELGDDEARREGKSARRIPTSRVPVPLVAPDLDRGGEQQRDQNRDERGAGDDAEQQPTDDGPVIDPAAMTRTNPMSARRIWKLWSRLERANATSIVGSETISDKLRRL
ncbi:hypothetical protein [Nocardia sputi]|uniref:hypothetical protein n=1 Tax=Nocardia sputi TaxID=2943705 RepID=UPI0020C0C30D|nr:hypothetical protein [Nocardia sputi]